MINNCVTIYSVAEQITLIYKDVGLPISYDLRKGGGESVVFIHGLGCCKECFKDVWDFPEYKKYTILAFDLPGFGDSGRPREYSYTMEEHATTCESLIEELNLGQIHLVGHSMGGAIGLLLVKRIRVKVRSFTSLEGNLICEDCTLSRAAISHSVADFEKTEFQSLRLKIRHSRDAPGIASSSVELFDSWLSKSDPYAFYRSSESLVHWSDSGQLLRLLHGLSVRKYYVFGEMNKNLPVIRLIDPVPKLQISRAGHLMMTDNPAAFYRELLRILLADPA